MNERINELFEKAANREFPSLISSIHPNELERFALLIVRECFDVVINDGRFHDAKGIIRAGKSVAMEHFGVEE